MKAVHLLAAGAAMLGLGAAGAEAQQRSPPFGPRVTLPSHSSPFGGSFGGVHKRGQFPSFFLIEREVVRVVEVEVPVAVPVVPPPPPAPPPAREPYVVGHTYTSLPGGCMKLIEQGVSYYYCGGGEWYRAVGAGRYKAIAKP